MIKKLYHACIKILSRYEIKIIQNVNDFHNFLMKKNMFFLIVKFFQFLHFRNYSENCCVTLHVSFFIAFQLETNA